MRRLIPILSIICGAALAEKPTTTILAQSASTEELAAAEETESIASMYEEKVGCSADLNGAYFNLKPLSKPVDE